MKRIITYITAAVIVAAPVRYTAFADDAAGYEYTIINNEVTITGFKGEPVYIEIPESAEGCRVTEIRDNAFYECGSLKHITLPDTIEKIGHHAFYACFSLESVTIPNNVKEIGMGCFCGCEALSSAVLPKELTRLPDSCFRSCTSLKSIEIPENTAEIGDFCFSGCTSLSSVSVSDSVTSIGDCSFYMCNSLDSLYIPASVEEIGICSVGYIPTDEGSAQAEGFIILGQKNSRARKYAEENHLTFECADDAVHAFAIKRISGQQVAIPSVMVIFGAVFLLTLLAVSLRKKHHRKK